VVGKVSSVCMANHIRDMMCTYQSREIFVKEVAVIMLGEGKSMLLLLEVCESCIE